MREHRQESECVLSYQIMSYQLSDQSYQDFNSKMGMHQGSELSPFFAVVADVSEFARGCSK